MAYKRVLSPVEMKVYNQYHLPSCSNFQKRKVNSFHFSAGNSYEHERKKFDIAFELLKTGCVFIMEAERNKKDEKGNRRIVDIVQLNPHIEWEIETDYKRALRFKGDDKVRVVQTDWSENDKKKYMEKMKNGDT